MSIDYQKVLLSATDNTITEYSVQTSTTEISPSAFINCNLLTNIIMEESLFSNIGSNAFSVNCKVNNENTLLNRECSDKSFSGRVIIPNDVTTIEWWAFYDCSSLTSVTIPSSVTTIGNYAFAGCSSLKVVHISDIATWCAIDFSDSSSNPLDCAKNLYLNGELITDLVIPDGVTEIKMFAFKDCSSLTSVTIPESVTRIGGEAFSNCSGLTYVTIPSSVRSIGHNIFYKCSSLTNIILENRTLEEAKSLIGTSNTCGYTGTITYNGGTYDTVYNNPYEQQ